MITQERLKELLHYDPDTGIFINRTTRSSNCVKGRTSGTYDKHGYRTISLDHINYKAHRLAWLYVNGEFPKKGLDHKNTIKDDNRIDNLREANQSENGANNNIYKNNKSGYKGVFFEKFTQRWKAALTKNGKSYNLGRYDTPEEAHEAYKKAALEYHGEFAKKPI